MSKISKNNEIELSDLSFIERTPVVDPADIADFCSTAAAEENFRLRGVERRVDHAVWLGMIAILLLFLPATTAVSSLFRNLNEGWLALSCFKPSIIPTAVYIISILAIYRALKMMASEPSLPTVIGKSYKTKLWLIAGLASLGILPAVIWCLFVATVLIIFCWNCFATVYSVMFSGV